MFLNLNKHQLIAFVTLIILLFLAIILCFVLTKFFCNCKHAQVNLHPIAKISFNTTKFVAETTVKVICIIKNLFSINKNEFYVHFTYMTLPPQETEWAHRNGNFTEIGYYRLLVINNKIFSKTWLRYKFEYGSATNVSSQNPFHFQVNVHLKKTLQVGKIGCSIKWTDEYEVWKITK